MALGHSPQIVRDGLVLHLDAANPKSYPGSGVDAYDLTKGNNAELINGTSFVSSDLGAFLFDGVNDYVKISNMNNYQLRNTNQITVSVWFKANLFSSRQYIFENRAVNTTNPFPTFIDNINGTSGNLRLYVNRDQTIQTIYTNTFYNLVYSIDLSSTENNLKSYINYSNQGIYSVSYSSSINSSPDMFLGRAYPTSAYRFNGNIYQFSFYNKVLSQLEIKQNFEAYRDRYGI